MAPVRTGATAKFPSQGLLSRQRCGDSGVLSSGSEKSVGSWACCTPAQDRSQCAIISLEREAGAHHSAKYLLNHSYFLPNFSGLFFGYILMFLTLNPSLPMPRPIPLANVGPSLNCISFKLFQGMGWLLGVLVKVILLQGLVEGNGQAKMHSSPRQALALGLEY